LGESAYQEPADSGYGSASGGNGYSSNPDEEIVDGEYRQV